MMRREEGREEAICSLSISIPDSNLKPKTKRIVLRIASPPSLVR